MELTYENLKNEMDEIINEFQRTLLNGDYISAKKITSDLLKFYKSTYGVELDRKPEFDHDFQEAMKKMDESLSRIHPSADKTRDYIDVYKTFSEVVDQVMHVNEVRRRAMTIEPTAETFIESYTKGIEEANNIKNEIKEARKKFNKITDDLFLNKGVDFSEEFGLNKYIVGRSQIIIDKSNQIAAFRQAIDDLNAQLASGAITHERADGHIAENTRLIAEGENVIRSFIEELNRNGIDTTKLKDLSDIDDIKRQASIHELEKLKLVHENKLKSNYGIILSNLKKAKNKYFDMDFFRLLDYSKLNPSTEEGRQAIDRAVEELKSNSDRLDKLDTLQDNRIKIFTDSINQVKEEQKILDIDTSDTDRLKNLMTDDVKNKIAAEKAWYKQDAIDKMYGSPEKAEKWKKYFELLKSAEKEVDFEYTDDTGARKTGKYKTIDYDKFGRDLSGLGSPTSVEEALKLLQLEEYKERLERITRFKAGDQSVFTELPSYKKLLSATTDEEKKAAIDKLKQELEEDMIYVATNHGAVNNYDLEARAIGNAGTLARTGSVAELIGLSSPSHAKSILGKAGIVALDVLAIATAPITIPTKYFYKRFPVIGKKAQMDRYIKEHDGKHSSPYEGKANARKVIRRAEYKSQIKGPFKGARAWIRATADDLWNDARAKRTEAAVIDRECNERIFPSIDARYVEGARNSEKEKQEKAKENLQIRARNAQEIAKRDYVYNDLIADPNEAKYKELRKQTILGAALEQSGENAEELRYSKTLLPRDRRFTGIKGAIGALHSDLVADKVSVSKPDGSVVQTDPISGAQRDEGIVREKTLHNYVPYVLTGAAVTAIYYTAANIISGSLKNAVPSNTSPKATDKTPQSTPGNDSGVKNAFPNYGFKKQDYKFTIDIPETKTTLQMDTHSVPRTPAEFAKANDGISGTIWRSVSGGERGGVQVDFSQFDSTKGFYIEFLDKAGKKQSIGFSSPENGGMFRYLSKHVTEFGLDDKTISKFIDSVTGKFKDSADLYDLAAEIANKTGKTQGITGDDLVKQVYSGKAKAYYEPVKVGRYGGWIDTTKIVEKIAEKEVTEVIGTTPKDFTISFPTLTFGGQATNTGAGTAASTAVTSATSTATTTATNTATNTTKSVLSSLAPNAVVGIKKGCMPLYAAWINQITVRGTFKGKSDLPENRDKANNVKPKRYDDESR